LKEVAMAADAVQASLNGRFTYRADKGAHSDTSDQVFRRHMISHSGVSDHPEMTPSGAVW
jgi:hypothetical protein